MTDEAAEKELAYCLNWMRTRPDSVAKLMRRFPPGCVVTLKRDVELCEDHEDLAEHEYHVGSYTEEGDVGVVHLPTETLYYIKPEYLEIVRFREEQTIEWVATVLDGEDAT